MKLILHVGPHKSGSSAIQHCLRSGQFEQFYYPSTGQWPDGSHHCLVFSMIRELTREGCDLEPQETYIENLRHELQHNQCPHLLISSEFLGLNGEYAERLARKLVKAGLISASSCHDAILVSREHVLRASSLFNQAVKDPVIGETRSPDQYLKEEAAVMCYKPLVNSFRSFNFSVDAVAYEPADNLVQRFLQKLGASEAECPLAASTRNVGLCRTVMLGMLAVNRAMATVEDRLQFFAALKTIRPAFRRSDNIFSDEALHGVLKIFSDDAAWMDNQFQAQLNLAQRLDHYRSALGDRPRAPIRLRSEERSAIDAALSQADLDHHPGRTELREELDRLMEPNTTGTGG